MRQSTGRREDVRGADERLISQEATERLDLLLDLLSGPVGNVGQGALDDATALAEGLAQEYGWAGAPVGDRIHVHGRIAFHTVVFLMVMRRIYLGPNSEPKEAGTNLSYEALGPLKGAISSGTSG
jgi:hypothetical protein